MKKLKNMSAIELRTLGTRTPETVIHENGRITDSTYHVPINGEVYRVYLGPGVRTVVK